MSRTVAFRVVSSYALIVLAVSFASPREGIVSYPAVLCTSIGLPALPLSFNLCTQKTVYNLGETANITAGLKNNGRNTTWIKESEEITILNHSSVVLSDLEFCGADFGCELKPLQMFSWEFHWRITGLGKYTVTSTLDHIEFFQGEYVTGYKLASQITIGLTIMVV